jgi:hypothetical protein
VGNGRKTRTVHNQWWLTHLLLLTFAVRALVPAGYMPDFGSSSTGDFKVVICTATGPKALVLDEKGDPTPDSDHHHQPCTVAGLAMVALPSFGPLVPVTADFVAAIRIPLPAATIPPARAGPQRSSRGPPHVL